MVELDRAASGFQPDIDRPRPDQAEASIRTVFRPSALARYIASSARAIVSAAG